MTTNNSINKTSDVFGATVQVNTPLVTNPGGNLTLSSANGSVATVNSVIVDSSQNITNVGALATSASTYNAGTVSQTGTTVTGSGTTFTSVMIGGLFTVVGQPESIVTAVNSATSLTVSTSTSIPGSSAYKIYYGGVQFNSGTLGVENANIGNITAKAIVQTDANNNLTATALTDGQLLIGSTGNNPVPAAITSGVGISIVNAPGSITISSSSMGAFPWNVITGTSATLSSNNGYFANNASLVTLTLPATSSVGDQLEIAAMGNGGFKIAQAAGQSITFGNTVTTPGTGGSISSTQKGDSIRLVCNVANNSWFQTGPTGNMTIV